MDQQEISKVFSSKGWDIILQALEDHHIGLLSAQESVKDPNDALAKVKITEGFGQALSLLFRLSSRGEKKMALPWTLRDKGTSKEGEGEKEEEKGKEQGEEEKEKQSQSKSTPTDIDGEGEKESQSPFQDSRLVGKSEAEIADKILLLETVVKEQGTRLNEVHRKEGEVKPGPGEGEKVKEEVIEPADYYKDPVSVTERIVQKAIKEQMTESIRPFMEDLRTNRSASAWDNVGHLPKVNDLRPAIELYLQRSGITEVDAEAIEGAYDIIRGKMARGVINLPGIDFSTGEGGEGEGEMKTGHRDAPPQHSPSSQPLKGEKVKTKTRELTESEALLARSQGMTNEEYVAWQDLDESHVLLEEKEEAKTA